jgi:phage terminase Nu1 subunit (DNA packaging protein)
MSQTIVNRKTLAKVLGISVRTVANLETDGVVQPVERGQPGRSSTFDLAQAVPAYIAHETPNGRTEARARKELANAKLAELKLAKERGELVKLDDVLRECSVFDRALVAKLRAIPNRAVNLGIVDRVRAAQLDALIRELREEISNWKHIEDGQQAIDDAEPIEGDAQ